MKNNKLRIALIDSGISNNFQNRVVKGVSILYDSINNHVQCNDDYLDVNGHGTFCAQVIESYCKEVEYIVIKVLDEDKKGHSKALIEALNYIMPLSIDLINLSLSVVNDNTIKQIEELCSILERKKVVINVSVTNNKVTSFPASLKSTVGIRGSFYIPSDKIWYNPNKEIQCVANMTPVLVCSGDNRKTFFGGNSKATAAVTGLMAKTICEKHIQGKETFRYLSERIDWSEEEVTKEFDPSIIDKAELELEEFAFQVCDILKLSLAERKNILEKPLCPPFFKIDKEVFIELIVQLSIIHNRELELGKWEISKLISIASLYKIFVEKTYE